MVWEAYKKVRANKGSAGVDNVSMEEFDANRAKYLYKLWNRMASVDIPVILCHLYRPCCAT